AKGSEFMGLRDLLGGLRRAGGAEGLREQARREFAAGNNAAGVAALLKIGDDSPPDILFEIGECYEAGRGVILNFATAAAWFERAAVKGHLAAQAKLGDFYLFGRRAHGAAAGTGTDDGTGASRLRPK